MSTPQQHPLPKDTPSFINPSYRTLTHYNLVSSGCLVLELCVMSISVHIIQAARTSIFSSGGGWCPGKKKTEKEHLLAPFQSHGLPNASHRPKGDDALWFIRPTGGLPLRHCPPLIFSQMKYLGECERQQCDMGYDVNRGKCFGGLLDGGVLFVSSQGRHPHTRVELDSHPSTKFHLKDERGDGWAVGNHPSQYSREYLWAD